MIVHQKAIKIGEIMATRILFTGKVDHKYAWPGNEAEGCVDILTELSSVISSAKKSIAVSTMTFSYRTDAGKTQADSNVENIAALLAQKASQGIDVRIMANGGHRFQSGYFRAQRGPVMLSDNNLPALVYRISFQKASSPAPSGYLVDSGAKFGARSGGLSYGWDKDVSASISPHGNPDATFTTALLRECYAASNSAGSCTWSIKLPADYYYVLVATGEAAYSSKSFVHAQGQTIFIRKNASGKYQYYDYTDNGAGEFECSAVEGGKDQNSGLAVSRRLQVKSDGMLNIIVGQAGEVGYSSIDYIEIYRASDVNVYGDKGLDKKRIQERGIHHSKFILVDAGTRSQRLWTGSHNLTPVDPTSASTRSEDALLTDVPEICTAFRSEFDQWWGASSGKPDAGLARNGVFKIPVVADGTMPGHALGSKVTWGVRFSPSTTKLPGLDLYKTVSNFIAPRGSSVSDLLLVMEQFTDGGTYTGSNGTFNGPTQLVKVLKSEAQGGVLFWAMIGDQSPTESIFTDLTNIPSAKVKSLPSIHDKFAVINALKDTPAKAKGAVLFGSMNWSQGAMHVNDEQTLIIWDPWIANIFLQRAAQAAKEASII